MATRLLAALSPQRLQQRAEFWCKIYRRGRQEKRMYYLQGQVQQRSSSSGCVGAQLLKRLCKR